jgi:hypothetical protein
MALYLGSSKKSKVNIGAGFEPGYALGYNTGYDAGFEEGKASGKLIKFYVGGYTWVALLGMTWREYVECNIDERFYINNEIIHYESESLGYSADDKIVENGIYESIYTFMLKYNSDIFNLNHYSLQSWTSWVESDFNTIGLYFNDEGILKTPTGETVFTSYDLAGFRFPISISMDIEWKEYEALSLGYCDLSFETTYFDLGMTWEEYANSIYNNGVYIDGEAVNHYADGGGKYYYNGVQVKPTDKMIEGAYYQYQ